MILATLKMKEYKTSWIITKKYKGESMWKQNPIEPKKYG